MTSRASLVPTAVLLATAACGGAKPATTTAAPPPVAAPAAPVAAPAAEPVAPPTPAAKAHKVRTVEGITEYKLDNGLQVLLFPDPTQSNVTVNITYLVGSRLEGYGETGMAHLLEHMMFKGSKRHRNVLKLTGERGGQANGSTSYDRTNYFETLPASQENLDWALDLEADRMIHAEVSREDLDTEFSVVRNEFESDENSPENILGERVTETAFLWHNYGKPTIGSRTDIERVPVPALRAFYEKYYQPDDAVLIVSGKFDDAAALGSIEKLFGAIPKPARTLAQSYTVEPAQDGERTVTLRRTGDVSAVMLAYHSIAGSSPEFPALEAALDVLTRKPSGRLYKALVETKLAAQIGGYAQPQHDPFLGQIFADVRDPKNVDKVQQILIAQTEALGNSKIDDKELERYRSATLKDIELTMANSEQIAIFLSEWAALGDWRTMFSYREAVKKVTAADVQRVAKTYFKASNRTLGLFVPTKDIDRAPLVEAPNVADVVKGIDGGEVKDKGEVFAATLDNIEARTKREKLAGGITAALLPKKTRGGKVMLSLHLHWGDEKSLQNKATLGSLLGAAMARGTAKKSFQEVRDLEDQHKARVWISSSADGLTLNIQTLRDQLPAALDLGGELLTAPAFSDKEVELVKQEELAGLEQQQQDPMTIAFQTFEQLTTPWPKADPRYPASPREEIEEIKKVTAAQLRGFYKEFVGAGHGELVVVGDFDPALVKGKVEKLATGWQTKKPYARLAHKPFGVAGQSKEVDLKDKEQTTITFGHDVALRDTDVDYPAFLMLSQVLGGDAGSRTWMRLREHEGLSYGVATWAYAGTQDDAGGIAGYAIVAPQNLAKAKTSLQEEFAKIAAAPVTADELQRAKEGWLKEQDTSLSDDDYVAHMLSTQLFVGRTNEFTKDLRAKIAAVTVADVSRVSKKLLDPKRLVIVNAGDVAKQKAGAPGK